jgi:hypothetical protein
MDLLWQALKKNPRSLYDLVDEIFPDMPQHEVFLTISGLIGHLEILIDDGRVMIIDHGPPALYQSRYYNCCIGATEGLAQAPAVGYPGFGVLACSDAAKEGIVASASVRFLVIWLFLITIK